MAHKIHKDVIPQGSRQVEYRPEDLTKDRLVYFIYEYPTFLEDVKIKGSITRTNNKYVEVKVLERYPEHILPFFPNEHYTDTFRFNRMYFFEPPQGENKPQV